MPLITYLKHFRWDSSDPDRAPPPLPLNPGSPNLATRANTSANIVAAAQVLQEKARESAGPSPYTTNPMPNAQKSPERSLIKRGVGGSSSSSGGGGGGAAAAQKRLQSLSTPSVRDLRGYLDGARTPTDRSPERRGAGTPTRAGRDTDRGGEHMMIGGGGSPEKSSQNRHSTPTPMPAGKDIMKEGSALLRQGGRGAPKALLGENVPPAAASSMITLHTNPGKEMDSTFGPVANVSATASTTATTVNSKLTPSFDVISSQIMSLTNIATNLQREMSQLSRRSKDNASDLISLKEATHRRDEDIRLSLRDLVASVTDVPYHYHQNLLTAPPTNSATRPVSSMSFLDSKMTHSPPSAGKSISLPRIPSPNSFLMDERVGSPSPYSVEGAASVAMLEKIIREMATKDGQERLLSNLSQVLDKCGKESVDKSASTAQKVEELADFIKSQNQALVHRGNKGGNFDENGPSSSFHDAAHAAGPLAKISRELKASNNHHNDSAGSDQKPFSSPKAADFVSAEMLKLLKKIKDSVAESGGMTAEVKALVRDLRSEVLGMGRELGRKIDEADRPDGQVSNRGMNNNENNYQLNEVARIVQEGLEEMREHMEHVIRENRRQSSSSSVISRGAIDSQEVYGVVKHALAEHDFSYGSGALQTYPDTSRGAMVQKEEILTAVKDAYEAYKPEIEVQQFGLERDEILQCLREGLEDYRSSSSSAAEANSHGQKASNISREEIMEAVQEAMQNFTPPAPVSEAHEIREEILLTVRECLEDYKPTPHLQQQQQQQSPHAPPIAPHAQNSLFAHDIQATTEAVLEAVRDGFAIHGPAAPRELEISREDLFEAVKAGLEQSSEPLGPNGEQILSPLHGLVEEMRVEFKQYSAANGRDTEQVLDAVKDGLESLRAEIESYVDRAQDVTGKDEIVDTVRSGLEQLREDVRGFVTVGQQGEGSNRADVINYIKAEFEHMHESISTQIAPAVEMGGTKESLLQAVHDGMDMLKDHIRSRHHHGGNDGEYDERAEVMAETLKEDFEQLKDAVLMGTAAHRDEIMETIQESIQNLQLSVGNGDNRDASEMIAAMRDEFSHLREAMASSIVRSGRSETSEQQHNDEALESIKVTVEGLRTQIAESQNDAASELQGTLREELEHLRHTLSTTLVQGGGGNGSGGLEIKDELEALRVALEGIRSSHGTSGQVPPDTTEELIAIKGELEHLRQSIASTMVHNNSSRADTEEILETVRLGLDDLRSHLEKKFDNPEKQMSSTNEIIDALTDGLDGLRADMPPQSATAQSAFDSNVSSEVVNALRDDISSIREDIKHLRVADRDRDMEGASFLSGNEVVLADSETPKKHQQQQEKKSALSEVGTATVADMLRRNDLEKMEVMMAQLQIKVEAMDQNILNPPAIIPTPTSAPQPAGPSTVDEEVKQDLSSIETVLKELQATIDVVAQREVSSDVARKEDTDAIETLLRNTKAKLEEMDLPEGAVFAMKDNLETVEGAVRLTQDSVQDLAERLENSGATKSDVAVVEVLVQDVKTALEKVKDDQARLAITVAEKDESSGDKVEKADLDVLGVLCTEIKDRVASIALPDADELPSKADLEQLRGLIHDFRGSHDRLKDSYETDIAVTARAFDDRKQEAKELADNVEHVKEYLEEIKDEIQNKLEEGGKPFDEIKDLVKGLDDTIGGHFNVTADVKELVETVTREFERTHGSIDVLRVDQEERAAVLLDKHDEASTSVIAEVSQKMEDHFNALMAKYDDAQIAADAQVKATEAQAVQQEELMSSTKAMAEDLKVTIDTLGTSVLGLSSTFTEATDKISDDSKTVFGKVEEVFGRLDEAREKMDATYEKIDGASQDNKVEHQLTREEVSRAVTTLGSIQGEVSEFHPQFADTLKEVLLLVTQHYEHSQRFQEQAQEHNRIAAEESKARTDEIKSSFSDLPALLPPPAEPQTVDRYDDTVLQEKLDRLTSQAAESHQSLEQLQRLDDIHKRVLDTAAEVTEFVTMQTRLITEDHESKEKEIAEQAVIIERQKAEKERLEADIAPLRTEKQDLQCLVGDLKSDSEMLSAQKMRLMADVASLQTVLSIRREELNVMETKANTLERRILDGIMDHSRALMIARSAVKSNTVKQQQQKQQPFARGSRNTTPIGKQPQSQHPVPSPAANSLSLALKTRPGGNKDRNNNSSSAMANGSNKKGTPRRSLAAPTSNSPANRRILSLSQITHNVPTGAAGAGAGAMIGLNSAYNNSLKRSQSTKNPSAAAAPRKSSWAAGKRNVSMNLLTAKPIDAVDEDEDKENAGADGVEKVNVDDDEGDDGNYDDFSDAGTERRTSGTRTIVSKGTGISGTTDETAPPSSSTLSGITESSRSRSVSNASSGGETATATATGSVVSGTSARPTSSGSGSGTGSVTGVSSSSYSYMTGSETGTEFETETETESGIRGRSSYGSTMRSVLGRESILEEEEENEGYEDGNVSDGTVHEHARDDDADADADADAAAVSDPVTVGNTDEDDEIEAVDFATPSEYRDEYVSDDGDDNHRYRQDQQGNQDTYRDTEGEAREAEDEVQPLRQQQQDKDLRLGLVPFDHAYDSGLGSDLPTATLSPSVVEGEFFGRGGGGGGDGNVAERV